MSLFYGKSNFVKAFIFERNFNKLIFREAKNSKIRIKRTELLPKGQK